MRVMEVIKNVPRFKLQMSKFLFKFKIVSLTLLVLLLYCQRKQDVWSKMSEKETQGNGAKPLQACALS